MNIRLVAFVAILSALFVSSNVRQFALAKESSAVEQMGVVVFFMFPDQEIRQALSRVDRERIVSTVRPDKFSESRYVVYILEDWSSAKTIQGSEVLGPALDKISKLPSKTVSHLADFQTSNDKELSFLFINSSGLPASVDWDCLSRFLMWVVSGKVNDQPFSFERCG
ncbi:hypothetical protein KUV51_00380 [Tateyamaria omphalii]|uniref:hypothetical protein n=1 Tax=Tateyamaria omphalii TaxID=299262 RepID=UPI001C996379|nr:hypothetical protein [Tateyamaria omphalii]MBY5931437.1 hypothetical protein [Tateyamaria omphalii]